MKRNHTKSKKAPVIPEGQPMFTKDQADHSLMEIGNDFKGRPMPEPEPHPTPDRTDRLWTSDTILEWQKNKIVQICYAGKSLIVLTQGGRLFQTSQPWHNPVWKEITPPPPVELGGPKPKPMSELGRTW